MSNDGARDLQDRWNETGAVEDEAAWLLHRMQAGSIDAHRIEVAAMLGHLASRLVVGVNEDTSLSLGTVLKALADDFQASVRAAIAALRLGLSLLTGRQAAPWIQDGTAPALQVGKKWAICPCEEHARLAHAVAADIETRADAADEATTAVGDWWSYQAVQVAHFIPAAIALESGLPEPCPVDPLGPDAVSLLHAVCEEFARFPSHVTRSEAQALAAIASDLIPWALGYGDPIRERLGGDVGS